MEEQLVSFETAKSLHEIGFDWKVMYYYTVKRQFPTKSEFEPERCELRNWNDAEGMKIYDRYSAPTQSLAQKWLRWKYNLHINVIANADTYFFSPYKIEIVRIEQRILRRTGGKDRINKVLDYNYRKEYKNFEDALEIGLQKAAKIVKDKQHEFQKQG